MKRTLPVLYKEAAAIPRAPSGDSMPKADAQKVLSLFALLFLLLVALLCLTRRVAPALCAAYLAASGASFVLYWVDKSAAAGNRRRIRERNLLLLGALPNEATERSVPP